MIAAWMVYASATAAALALAAAAVERGLALYRRPARLAWLAALLAGFWFPLGILVGGLSPAGGPSSLGSVVGAMLPPLRVGPANAYGYVEVLAGPLDGVLLVGWVLASGAILGWLAATHRRLRRDGAAWSHEELDGMTVLVSPDVGPALVGLAPSSIVVPRWFRDLPVETRRLALLHEREHLQAGDARLLLLGVLTAALAPWNPALWWMLRRLRAAVELDCDTRVLMGGVNAREYGGVLLEVGERSVLCALARPALAAPESLLSRRISALLSGHTGTRWPWGVVYGLTAVTLLALACSTPPPDGTTANPTGAPAAAAALAGAVPENTLGLEPPSQVSAPPLDYPRTLREAGVEGRVAATVIIGTDGRVEPGSIQILQASNAAFEAPTRAAIEATAFRPGRLHGELVRVRAQMQVRFMIVR